MNTETNKKKKDLRKKPRWFQHIRAVLGGYFWLPCPICGEKFGGHEEGGSLATSYSGGKMVCKNCSKAADKINKENNYFIPKIKD
jgi:hypothetical protein